MALFAADSIPEVLTADVTGLDIGDQVRISAIALPMLLKYGYPRSWM